MRKWIYTLPLILSLCLSMISCSAIEDFWDGELHGDLEFVSVPDCEQSVILYHGTHYYPTDRWLSVDEEMDLKEATEIGWGTIFPFPDTYFLVYETENPLFIAATDQQRWSADEIYLRRGMKALEEVYLLGDTDVEVVLGDVITKAENDREPEDYSNGRKLTLHLKEDPRLVVSVEIYPMGEDCFFVNAGEQWILNQEFIALLKEQAVWPE